MGFLFNPLTGNLDLSGGAAPFIVTATDTASVDITVVAQNLSAVVLPAGVDHNLLQNFVANKHIDHSLVNITAGTGLSGGGDITASRTLNIANTTVVPTSYGSASQVPTYTVNAQGQLTTAANVAIAITSAAVTDFTEAAQDAVGTILTDTASVDFTYNDALNTISAAVLPAGVDHNLLQNYSANQHVDHTAVQIATAATTSGLTGGGTIAATRNLSVDINGTTAETVADNADKVLIYDNSATALKSMTRANFLSGLAMASAGDIAETSFSGANNQIVAANVTGFAFANASVRSFDALVSVYINATSSLYETYKLLGVQRGADWQLQIDSTGDLAGVLFSITNLGQIQYTSSNNAGFVSMTMKFRAITTGV